MGMKLLLVTLTILASQALAAPSLEEEETSPYYALQDYIQQQRGAPGPVDRELLAEYLASLEDTPPEMGNRSKRWRWYGNKYKDNKSYGFWITALNKAGNVKRGKRSAFLPAMGPLWMTITLLLDLPTIPTLPSW